MDERTERTLALIERAYGPERAARARARALAERTRRARTPVLLSERERAALRQALSWYRSRASELSHDDPAYLRPVERDALRDRLACAHARDYRTMQDDGTARCVCGATFGTDGQLD